MINYYLCRELAAVIFPQQSLRAETHHVLNLANMKSPPGTHLHTLRNMQGKQLSSQFTMKYILMYMFYKNNAWIGYRII